MTILQELREEVDIKEQDATALSELEKYGIKALKGGTIEDLRAKHEWLFKAKFKDLLIRLRPDGKLELEGGEWLSGTFERGSIFNTESSFIWHSGTFLGRDCQVTLWKNGSFEGGSFYGDVWENGIWDGLNFVKGTWKNGQFEGGVFGRFREDKSSTLEKALTADSFPVFEGGVFENGVFANAIWKGGEWKGGTLNNTYSRMENMTFANVTCENGHLKNCVWDSGNFKDGVFDGGTWKKGRVEKGLFKGVLWEQGTWGSRGSLVTSTQRLIMRNCRWKGGVWYEGHFTGEEGVWEGGMWVDGTFSDATWLDGTWQNGVFDGGVWKNGVWEDGVWEDGVWEDGTWRGGDWKKGTWKGGFRDIADSARKEAVVFKDKAKISKHPILYKIENITLQTIADILIKENPELEDDTIITIKDLSTIAKRNLIMNQMLTRADGHLLKTRYPRGFSLRDLMSLSKDLAKEKTASTGLASLFDTYKSKLKLGKSKWKGTQRLFLDQKNHVLQINLPIDIWKNLESTIFKDVLKDKKLKAAINKYLTHGGIDNPHHPTSNQDVTLAWIRYTILPDDKGVVVDEIQTDWLSDEWVKGDNGFKEIMLQLMKGWEEYAFKTIIRYARQVLRIRKLYIPTYQTKLDKYHADPPMYLYKELPNKFGFKKKSDLEGFMLLENKRSKLLKELQDIIEAVTVAQPVNKGEFELVQNIIRGIAEMMPFVDPNMSQRHKSFFDERLINNTAEFKGRDNKIKDFTKELVDLHSFLNRTVQSDEKFINYIRMKDTIKTKLSDILEKITNIYDSFQKNKILTPYDKVWITGDNLIANLRKWKTS